MAVMAWWPLALLAWAAPAAASSAFLLACSGRPGLQCEGSVCQTEGGELLGLVELRRTTCATAEDCMADLTGLICRAGRCDCPRYQAFNLTACACQSAAACPAGPATPAAPTAAGPPACHEHNGRRCEDRVCSCFSSLDYSSLLVDPATLFCVLPGSGAGPAGGTGAGSLGLAVLGALLGFISVVLIAVLIVMAYKHCVCEKGDYECDVTDDVPEQHIAAWDHPSLDYVSKDEEDIVFTLCQAGDPVRQSNASTIYVMDEETSNFALADHDNLAYVEEEEPRPDD